MLSIFADSFSDGFLTQNFLGAEIALAAQVDGRAGSLIVSIRRFDASPALLEKRRIRKLTPAEVDTVRAAIVEMLPLGVRLPAIADAVGLCASQFSRAFRASMGETFSTYLMRIRIETAMRLLTETRLTLCDIAIDSGFSDQSNFSRAFAKSAGLPPFKWRLLAAERSGKSASDSK